jgi:hypothetical protein
VISNGPARNPVGAEMLEIEGNPDNPGTLIHFTGRPRAGATLPNGVPPTAEGRLTNLVMTDLIRASVTHRTTGPVVCFSELSDIALRTQLSRGFTRRGPYQPWAVVLRKDFLVQWGARPVWYMSSDEMESTASLPTRMRDRRVRSVPGGEPDWLHEREWRLCLDGWPGHPPATEPGYYLIPGSVVAVIVGQPDWLVGVPMTPTFHGVPRWLSTSSGLFTDGNLT